MGSSKERGERKKVKGGGGGAGGGGGGGGGFLEEVILGVAISSRLCSCWLVGFPPRVYLQGFIILQWQI